MPLPLRKEKASDDEAGLYHLELLASGIAGKTTPVIPKDLRPGASYTDIHSIYVPRSTADQLLFDQVIAQACLLRAASFRREFAEAIIGRRALALRYLFAEIARCARQHKAILPRKFCTHSAFSAFAPTPGNSRESMEIARSDLSFPPLPDFLGIPRPRTTLAHSARYELEVSDWLERRTEQRVEQAADPSHGDLDIAKDEKADLSPDPQIAGGRVTEFLRKILGLGDATKLEQSTTSLGAGLPMITAPARQEVPGAFSASKFEFPPGWSMKFSGSPGSGQYPEWDAFRKRYRTSWTLVRELDPWSEQPMTTAQLERVLAADQARLRHSLSGFGIGMEIHQRQSDGEDISLEAMAQYAIDLSTGRPPSDQLYSRRRQTHRDLAAIILVDVSSSIASGGDDDLHIRQAKLAWQMLCALHDLGDHVALYGFRSWGRETVQMLRVKSFSERHIGKDTVDRLTMLQPDGFSRFGAPIRHATRKLISETRARQRLVIIATDGFAFDNDYQGRYAREDTRRSLQEMQAQGVGCLCLAMGIDQDFNSLSEIFGPASTLAATSYKEMVESLRPMFANALSQTA